MKIGEYVKIRDNVHDEHMPKNQREGLIIEIVGENKDQAMVLFSNNSILKFHKSCVIHIRKS